MANKCETFQWRDFIELKRFQSRKRTYSKIKCGKIIPFLLFSKFFFFFLIWCWVEICSLGRQQEPDFSIKFVRYGMWIFAVICGLDRTKTFIKESNGRKKERSLSDIWSLERCVFGVSESVSFLWMLTWMLRRPTLRYRIVNRLNQCQNHRNSVSFQAHKRRILYL